MTTPRRFGHYHLLERMAGELFIARRDEDFRRLCAVKLLPELQGTPESLGRVHDEARVIVSMNHPNVVRAQEVAVIDGEWFVSMELVTGCDLGMLLADAWARQRALPIAAALFIACKVLRALEYCDRVADEQRVSLELVHRAIRPTNVLVSVAGEVKITLAVSPPLPMQTCPVDQRDTVFDVGVLLFELLVCERRAVGCDLGELTGLAQRGISSLRRAVPADLDEVLQRALAVDAEQRFDSKAELRAELERILRRVDPRCGPRQLASLMGKGVHAERARRLAQLLEISLPARGQRQRFGVPRPAHLAV